MHTTHPLTGRARTTLNLHTPGGLAALFAATRAEFGGHTMTAVPAPEAPPAAPPAADPAPVAGQAPPPAEPEVQDGDDAARLASRYTPLQIAQMALRYRGEAGDRRQGQRTAEQTAEAQATQAAEQATQAAIDQLKPGLVALGLLKADEETDPANLTERLTAESTARQQEAATARTLTIENAVLRLSTDDKGAQVYNATKLLDSRSFVESVASLDPTAADFSAKVGAAMKTAADKDATFKVARVAPRSGVPLSGGSGEQPRNTAPVSLGSAVAAAMQPAT